MKKGFKSVVFALGFVSLIFGACSSSAFELPAVFQGELNNLRPGNALSFVLDLNTSGKATIETKFIEGEKFDIFAKLEHIKVAGFDIFATLVSNGEFLGAREGSAVFVEGVAHVRELLLNSKPAYELALYYELVLPDKEGSGLILKIPYLKWGSCMGTAEIHFKKRPTLNLFLSIDHADLKDLEVLFDLDQFKEACPFFADYQEGSVNGSLRIFGPSDAPQIVGRLEMAFSDGLKNKKAVINFKGIYPNVEIEDSFIKKGEDSIFAMKGTLRLDELDVKSLEEGLEYFIRPQDKDTVTIMTERSQSSTLRLENKDTFTSNVGISEYMPEDRSVSFRGSRDSIELEHDLQKNKFLKMQMKSNEEIIGWEHKVRF